MTDKPHRSPHAALEPLPMTDARWTGGFWAERFELCRTTVIPRMREALEHPDNAAALSNFRVAAGEIAGEHRGSNWSDGDCYKWLQAMAHVFALTGDGRARAGLDAEMDRWIDLIARSQDEDGYISTQVQLDPEKQRWELRQHHELYNMGHLLTAASVHFLATGKSSFLDVAQRTADYLYATFAPRPPELARFGFNPSQIMGLVDLYRVTGDTRYLELAGIFVDMRGSAPSPLQPWGAVPDRDAHRDDQDQDRVPLREERFAVGHAVTACYLWAGATDVAAETGEAVLAEALTRIERDIAQRKLYVTGGVGAYHQGVSIRGDKVHEAFGREYDLPARSAYNETCSNIGNAMFHLRMTRLTGEARFADVAETVLHNAMLSAMDVDGTRFCYTNPLARSAGVELLSNDSPERWFTFRCYCCPPSVARTLAGLHEWAYGAAPEGLFVLLYGANVVNTELPGIGHVRLRQETDYPWGGRVRITIEEAPAGRFTLALRIPQWARGATLAVNDAPMAEPVPGEFARIEREWQTGDVVELALPMEPRLVQAHPSVESAAGQVAIVRGPVVYCLESADLPDGVPIHEVAIPRDIALTARWDAELLGGVVVLEGEALRRRGPDWEGRLYADLPALDCEPLPLLLIPYYAWLNRGPSEMRVWLPLA